MNTDSSIPPQYSIFNTETMNALIVDDNDLFQAISDQMLAHNIKVCLISDIFK